MSEHRSVSASTTGRQNPASPPNPGVAMRHRFVRYSTFGWHGGITEVDCGQQRPQPAKSIGEDCSNQTSGQWIIAP